MLFSHTLILNKYQILSSTILWSNHKRVVLNLKSELNSSKFKIKYFIMLQI
jgi:hypothetical protein